MSKPYDRRQVLKSVAAAGASFLLPRAPRCQDLTVSGLLVAGQNVEVQVAAVTAHTLRFTILPLRNGQVAAVPSNGSLAQTSTSWGDLLIKLREETQSRTVKSGNLRVKVSTAPLSFNVETE